MGQMRKELRYHPLAEKEFKELPKKVKFEFEALYKLLEVRGELREPEGKKIDKNLYEMRLRVNGQWRAFYGYIGKTFILICVFYLKKEQKTKLNIIKTAKKRIKEYENKE